MTKKSFFTWLIIIACLFLSYYFYSINRYKGKIVSFGGVVNIENKKAVQLHKDLVKIAENKDLKIAEIEAKQILLSYIPIGSEVDEATKFFLEAGFVAFNSPDRIDGKGGIIRYIGITTFPDNKNFMKLGTGLTVAMYFEVKNNYNIINNIKTYYSIPSL